MLSVSHRRLVDLCSRIGFGRIEHLAVSNGEPQFEPQPRIITEVKLGADSSAKEYGADFSLKPAVVDLFQRIDHLGNGSIRCLEIRHGLPFRIEIEGELTA
jgi:hypothetical protein